jgi:hypothetical protein
MNTRRFVGDVTNEPAERLVVVADARCVPPSLPEGCHAQSLLFEYCIGSAGRRRVRTTRLLGNIAATRGQQAIDDLRAFVEDMKATGFVDQALARHGIVGASVADPG